MDSMHLDYNGTPYLVLTGLNHIEADGESAAGGFRIVFRFPVTVRKCRTVDERVTACRLVGWLWYQGELLGILNPTSRVSLGTALSDNSHLQPIPLGVDLTWEQLQTLTSSCAGSQPFFHLWLSVCANGNDGVLPLWGMKRFRVTTESWIAALKQSGFSRSLGPGFTLPRTEEPKLSTGVSVLEQAIEFGQKGEANVALGRCRLALEEAGIKDKKLTGLWQHTKDRCRMTKDLDLAEAVSLVRSAAYCLGSIPEHHDNIGAGQAEILLAERLVAALLEYEAATR